MRMLSRRLISIMRASRWTSYASTISTMKTISAKNPAICLRNNRVCQFHESYMLQSASQDQTAPQVPPRPKNNTKSSKSSPGSPQSPRKIEKMPNSVTKMLLTGNTENSAPWPEFKTVCSLARRCGYAGVTIEEVEMYLLAIYRGKKKDKVKREPNFYSLHLINSWNKGEKVLEKMLQYFESILQSGRTGLPVKRLEYCMAVWRLAIIVQDCKSKDLDHEIGLLLKFSQEIDNKYSDKSLSILLFLVGIGHGREVGAWKDRYFTEISDIIKNLTKESLKKQPHQMPPLLMLENAEEIIQNILERNQSLHCQLELQSYLCRVQWSNRSFSKSLDTLGNATNTFLDAVDDDLDEGAKVGVALVEAWHALAVSALKLKMTPAIEYMVTLAEMAALKDQNGVGFLPGYVFWLIAKESVSGSRVALDLEKKVTGIGKLGEVNSVMTVKDSKFRRVFIVEGMTNETKAFFIKDFIMSLARQKVAGSDSTGKGSVATTGQTEVDATNVQQVTSQREQVPISFIDQNAQVTHNEQVTPQTSIKSEHGLQSNTSQQLESDVEEINTTNAETVVNIDEQLLTIKIIEAVSQGNIQEAVDIVLKEARDERSLEDAVSVVVSSLSKSGDLYNLDQLARALHAHHPSADAIYEAVVATRLKGIMQRWDSGNQEAAWDSGNQEAAWDSGNQEAAWDSGNQEAAWDRFLRLYTGILQDRAGDRILLLTGDKGVERCKRYGKIFIEETVGKNQEELIEYIREQVVDLYNNHGDLSMMSAYWEACFFSNRFVDQEAASDLLNQFPALVGDIVNIDPIIDRAERYGLESLHRKLIEVCLRHNLSPYHKSRAFEGLIRHQTRTGNVNSAAQTFNTAKSLDIRITADYLQDFFQLKFGTKDQEEIQNIGFFESIKNIFKKNK